MAVEIHHCYEYYDPIRRKRFRTKNRFSEAHAARCVALGEWQDARPIPGTRLEFTPATVEQMRANSTSAGAGPIRKD